MRSDVLVGERGITAVEILIGVSILTLAVLFSMYTIVNFTTVAKTAGDKTQALYLAEEQLELARFIRDASWASFAALPIDTPRYIAVTNTSVSVTTTVQTIGKFKPSFYVSNVYRDSNDRIVPSTAAGAVLDTGSRFVTATVTFGSPTSTVTVTSMLNNIDS